MDTAIAVQDKDQVIEKYEGFPKDVILMPTKRLLISYEKSDPVVKEGREVGCFYCDISHDIFFTKSLPVSILDFKASRIAGGDLSKLGPRSYFPGKFAHGGHPVCK